MACGDVLRVGAVELDREWCELRLRDSMVRLQPGTATLFHVLAAASPHIVPHATILLGCGQPASLPPSRARAVLRQRVLRLRQALREIAAPLAVVSAANRGYGLRPIVSARSGAAGRAPEAGRAAGVSSLELAGARERTPAVFSEAR